MAVLELNALSTALSGSFSATVVFPEKTALEDGKLYPALYLIHDVGGDDTDIRTVKNLQALSSRLGLFIICPSLMHSFGMDLDWGGKYGDFVSRELPGICRHMFPLDEAKQYIGGMGGGCFGAVWHAANHPEVFSKCITVNGRFDVASLCEAAAQGAPVPNLTVANLEAVFGDLNGVRGGKFDVLSPETPKPAKIFFGCEASFEAAGDSEAFAKQLGTTVHHCVSEEDVFASALNWLCAE